MPEISVTELDLQKAQTQIAVFEDMLSETDDMTLIASIKKSISQIKEEARNYDYLLNPRPAPEICTLCNGHPYVKMAPKPCPNCGMTLIDAQPADGKVHWKVPGETIGQALSPGATPE